MKKGVSRPPELSAYHVEPLPTPKFPGGTYRAFNALTETYRGLNALLAGANTCTTILDLTDPEGVPRRLPEPARSFLALHNVHSCEDLAHVKTAYRNPFHVYVVDGEGGAGATIGAIYSIRTDSSSGEVSFGMLVEPGARKKGVGSAMLGVFEGLNEGRIMRSDFTNSDETAAFFREQGYGVEVGRYNSKATKPPKI
ncbi:MAG: GNAT family N-acetyltransferase [Candidatus Aenigmarchaeota archaeon]|nr:GNAT family N-acetyltransferase [Candidatus Aenigmarchaeota archaeon]